MAHPRPGSFSHALADAAEHALRGRGDDVACHDLYAEGFDPVLTAAAHDDLVERHRRTLTTADTLVVVHPNWWGKPPAMMAGWMDRVLAPGVVYELDDPAGVPRSLLALRRLVVLNTGDTDLVREAAVFGDPLDAIWRRCVGTYLGEHVVIERLLAGPLAGSSDAQRAGWLEQAAKLTADTEQV